MGSRYICPNGLAHCAQIVSGGITFSSQVVPLVIRTIEIEKGSLICPNDCNMRPKKIFCTYDDKTMFFMVLITRQH
jgi:hypothetical protein